MSEAKKEDTTVVSGDDESAATDDKSLEGDNGGEYGVLLGTFDEDSAPLPASVEFVFEKELKRSLRSLKGESFYGKPTLSEKDIEVTVPPGDGGLIWYATIVPNDFVTEDGKDVVEGLNIRDYDLADKTIKPRRPSLPVTQNDFFDSLTKVNGADGTRYIFNGVLNGWPALRSFEVISLDRKRREGSFVSPKQLITGQRTWLKLWRCHTEGKKGIGPKETIKKGKEGFVYRAKLRCAPWSAEAWSKDSPGFVFWFEAAHPNGPRLSYGTNIVSSVEDGKCTRLHMLSHRYSSANEDIKDMITYHSAVLLEWDHGKFCSLLEGAYLNGLGGYNGKSNWYDDKTTNDGPTALYQAYPPEMIGPWLTNKAEIRCFDLPHIRTLDDFKAYVQKYTGNDPNNNDHRFMDPHFHFSHPCRLTYRSRSHIAQYVINYIRRDTHYSQLARNCQTFAADFACFLAGKKGVEPFHPVNRIEYTNRTHLFLYDPELYEK